MEMKLDILDKAKAEALGFLEQVEAAREELSRQYAGADSEPEKMEIVRRKS